MTTRAVRSLVAAVAAVVALFATPIDGASLVAPHAAQADTVGIPPVGARLVAVVDVELDEAVVRAGSHVSVVGRKGREGGLLFDVALADGHVVRGVPLQRLRASFRVA